MTTSADPRCEHCRQMRPVGGVHQYGDLRLMLCLTCARYIARQYQIARAKS